MYVICTRQAWINNIKVEDCKILHREVEMILVMSHISGIHTKFVIYGPLFGCMQFYNIRKEIAFYCKILLPLLPCRKVMSYFSEYFCRPNFRFRVDLFNFPFHFVAHLMFFFSLLCVWLNIFNVSYTSIKRLYV